jgi:rubrerythrin
MTKVTKYKCGYGEGMFDDPKGDYVQLEDYVKLENKIRDNKTQFISGDGVFFYCDVCGEDVEPDYLFCPYCGRRKALKDD